MLEINSLNEFYMGASILSDMVNGDDKDIGKLKKYVKQGWPRNIPKEILPYSKERDECTIKNQIVSRGARIVTPKRLPTWVLHLLR